ncbi:Eukaryotic translation initiation factor 3 subunit G [Cyberlindnera fabianii]|uniref:Eukaryotic translation initiation factor 3 subunit G n=1 Tax=Cyberlindnera fabianii TaxID=36022 RepID=A0A1V2LCV6_CYBFA|nr:Eukaryotic translation initiation factor 3 subunit G [Cyberlindnera fabianii]
MTTDPSCLLINTFGVLTYHHSRVAQWADAEVDQSAPQITTNPDGSKTVITYRINDDGKKVKVTQKIKEVVVRETVNKSVAARKKWAKFGAEKNAAPGPDFRTTQIGDPVFLRLGTSWKALEKAEEDKAEEDKAKERDDSSTLKIMQLNEIVTEDMIRDELLSGFGYIVRCNILRNRETGRSRGMAFVQFASETAAQSAMDHLNGRGYHNLILHIEWSKPRK